MSHPDEPTPFDPSAPGGAHGAEPGVHSAQDDVADQVSAAFVPAGSPSAPAAEPGSGVSGTPRSPHAAEPGPEGPSAPVAGPARSATEPGPEAGDPGPYQSLYRRFRPQRFSEVLGQEHVVVPLRNAVRHATVAHAYLFSGPRGTGKTSTARILAKALNCTDLVDGEPCGHCPSCVEITRGASLDVHELDAASNNGVDAMRELVSRAALGTPGRTKVYIVDEVHMLSTAASNALLKTLEEPPGHVVFVLATTDPQKVLATIRSRTQHFEFRLLGPDVLVDLLCQVRDHAFLGLDDQAVDLAVRRGRGSARDALSVLDQVAAGGMVEDDSTVVGELAEALAERDPTRVLVAVSRAMGAGYDPQRLAAELVDHLRQAFLIVMAPELVTVPDADRRRAGALGKTMGLAAVVRGMERLGVAQVAMRDAPDPRAHLEVALVRLAVPELDDSLSALVERVDRLERRLTASSGIPGSPPPAAPPPAAPPPAAPPPAAPPAPSTGGPAGARARAQAGSQEPAERGASWSSPPPVSPEPARPSAAPARGLAPSSPESVSPESVSPESVSPESVSPESVSPESVSPPAASAQPETRGPELARRTLGAVRRQRAAAPPPTGASTASAGEAGSTPTTASAGEAPSGSAGGDRRAPRGVPSREELVQAWGDVVLAALPSRARARFRVGRFVAVEDGAAVFALPNDTHRSYCDEVRPDVEAALGAHFGRPVPLRLVVDADADQPVRPPERGTVSGGTAPARPAASRRGSDRVAARPTASAPGSPSRGSAGSTVPPGTDDARSPSGTSGAPPPAPRSGSGASGNAAPSGTTGPARGRPPSEVTDYQELLDAEVLLAETQPAAAGLTPEQRLRQAFPGAEEV